MISEQNMGYGVSDLDVVGLFEKICRARVMEVWVDFGGHCILIGYPFPNAHEMHKNQELIHIRGWLSLFLERNIFSSSSFPPRLDHQPWLVDFSQHIENISSKLVVMVSD